MSGTTGNGFTVAIASDFLTAFSGLPRNCQPKVMEFLRKFKRDPSHPGINYEKLQRAKDPHLRSVRIDQAYRGIVYKPESGKVYMLLWVDLHDKAYQWAENKTFQIHPEIGSIQVIDVVEAQAVQAPVVRDAELAEKGLFAHVRDRTLVRLGLPEILLPLVRSLTSEDDLDRASAHLPQEVDEALYLLAAGYSEEQVFQELDKPKEAKPVDTSDFESALTNPDSQRRFYVVEDEWELDTMLNAPLEKWRVFLHPSQRKLVERHWNGPVRVLGGAGTGKTVVALHRARWLARHVFTGENDRILFTTFTRNLAADIRENLGKICSDEVMRRIEVVNLDKWVSDFLRRNGYRHEIDYGRKSSQLWEKALSMAPADSALPASFYREEWERVIQPLGVASLHEYLKASRVGRGVRLKRKERQAVWAVFEEYRVLLNEHALREADDAMRDARVLLEGKQSTLPYRSVIVDEAQDMGAQAFRLIRTMVGDGDPKNSLFIVGDGHQRIYRHRIVLGHCGIDIRGRSRKLRINYRTTEETRRWAVRLLEGVTVDDLDGGVDDQKAYKSLIRGVDPTVKCLRSFSEEVDFINAYLKRMEAQGCSPREACLVARHNDILKQYESPLSQKGWKTYYIRRSEPEDRSHVGLRLATMHRVKGLEFDRVIIAAVNEGTIFYKGGSSDSADPVIQREAEWQERALLYVAATRARKEVLVTSFGKPSGFLNFPPFRHG